MMEQTWQSNESLTDAWQNWKEFIFICFIVFTIEIIGMITLLVYYRYVFGGHFEKLDEYHKIAEWDIFIGTLILIVTNMILLFINHESITQPRELRKIKIWLIYHLIGLFIYIITTFNFNIVLRYMKVYHEYSDMLTSIVGWTYLMNIVLLFSIALVYYISYKPILSAYHRSVGNRPLTT